MPNVVVDASTLLGAVLRPQSLPRQAFERIIANHTLLASEAVLKELGAVLERPKFDRYASLALRAEFFALVYRHAIIHEPTLTIRACRDPKDDIYLSLAVSADAHAIVSSDDDLLCLSPFRGIPILTPRAFLEGNIAG